MINTSGEYKEKIKADYREIVPKVEVYFDATPTVFTEDDIVSLRILEELQSFVNVPVGGISANELILTLRNDERQFTPTNTASPYYNKINPRIKVVPYLGVRLSTGTEYIPLGQYYLYSLSAPADSVEATFTCYDDLFWIGKKKGNSSKVYTSVTAKKAFEIIFNAFDVTKYYIDDSLAIITIPYFWLTDETAGEILQKLALVTGANVYAGRDGKINVKRQSTAGTPVITMTDNDLIIAGENPQRYDNYYSKLTARIHYFTPVEDKLLEISGEEISPGTTALPEYAFDMSPVLNIKDITITEAANITANAVEYTATKVILTVNNSGAVAEKPLITITGTALKDKMSSISFANPVVFDERELEIDSIYIQNYAVAQNILNNLQQVISDPYATVVLETRGDPSLELGDIITAIDNADKLGIVNLLIYRQNIDFTGGLSVTIEGRKVG
ncbi:hypothetical protein [Carboxydothermus hydrogenoformans]|uniref:Uncharacterized protein n=1 Tax=Carboxydothermus hydrogenoformans (strain ATCC BAA-161 / DSM 6008 / Z-2901) TaxID=246194 RepID=Q3ABK4_CARHZ|nr:hypothetical protein [Carboxydothermus hydrogenoformans]ABB15636.1 hypothetical protein CHY_1660 [Carboxydothermus hydrogenoformans Z-2901]